MVLKKSLFYAIFYAIIVFIFSLIIFPYYTNGDQRFYTPFYNFCLNNNHVLSEQFVCYKETIGSQEPIYFILAKFFNFFSSKIFFSSFTNSVLFFLLVLLVLKYYKNIWHKHIFIIFLMLNFYMLALFFSVERLKIGFLFITLAFLFDGMKKYIFIFVSLIAHSQMVFLIIPYIISIVVNSKIKFKFKLLYFFASLFFIYIFFYLIKDQILYKLNIYYEEALDSDMGIIAVLKTSFFIFLASFIVRRKDPIIVGFPIIFMSYFLGSTRLGMMAFVVYLVYMIYLKRKMDFFLLMILCYYLYKSIGFINNVLIHGDGWV